MRGSRLLLDWCLIAACSTLLVVGFTLSGLTARVDNLLYDRLIVLRTTPPSDRLILIAIDNRSLQALGKWPWPRRYHAALLNQLAKVHPQAIAYDVLFTEAAVDDRALATAMRSAAPVYLPVLLDTPNAAGSLFSAVEPVPVLRQAAAGIGHVNVHFDNDGLVRRADLKVETDHHYWRHLMGLLAGANTNSPSPMPILFQPQIDAFQTSSFVDVMRGEVPAAFFKDRLVIVGATGDGMGDQFPVPLRGGGLMSGVDLQANMLNTMLAGRTGGTVPSGLSCCAALVPLWILLIGLWRWRPMTLLLVSLALVGSELIAAIGLFWGTGWWLAPTPAVLALMLVYSIWGWRRLAALSASVEYETRDFRGRRVSASRFAPVDRIADQVSDMRSAMAQSRTIRQSAQAREEALQMLSHDMRAPQASIITLLESESKSMAPALRARLSGYARRTLALADNFVQLARVNETPFAPEVVNLCDLVNEAIDDVYPLSAARKVDVVGVTIDEPHYVMAEPGLLIRALLNLLDNAIKYSPDGGSIECSVLREGTHVRCTIADHGVGMTEAQATALFQRFGPVGSGRNTGSSGAGLGLMLVKSVVERHGGTISYAGAENQGSAFSICLPAVDVA